MKKEDFYLAVAPIFATYLGVTSGNEALKFTSLNAAELDEVEARRLFVASLMSSPSSHFLDEKAEEVRQFGLALAQEEAGVERTIVVHSFLESMKALAAAKVEAGTRLFESINNALGALFLFPLFLVFLWSVGVFPVDTEFLTAVLFAVTAGTAAVSLVAMPRDLRFWKTYQWSVPAGLAAAALTALWSPLLSFVAFGAVAWIWLKATDRLWWFKVRDEVPAMLRSVAAMLREGAPPDLILGRLTSRFKTAAKVAYGYFIPSRYFMLAKAMYKAVVEAGGATAVKAVEYIQSLVDIETNAVKKMVKTAAAYFALFAAAVFVLGWSVATAVKTLGEAAAVNPFFSPPPYDEVKAVVTTAFASILAAYVTVFLMPVGVHYSSILGGVLGLAAQKALEHLF
ncbi:MAG: hypothetical protein ABWK05_08415 [Pyrobaculum sp.]